MSNTIHAAHKLIQSLEKFQSIALCTWTLRRVRCVTCGSFHQSAIYHNDGVECQIKLFDDIANLVHRPQRGVSIENVIGVYNDLIERMRKTNFIVFSHDSELYSQVTSELYKDKFWENVLVINCGRCGASVDIRSRNNAFELAKYDKYNNNHYTLIPDKPGELWLLIYEDDEVTLNRYNASGWEPYNKNPDMTIEKIDICNVTVSTKEGPQITLTKKGTKRLMDKIGVNMLVPNPFKFPIKDNEIAHTTSDGSESA